MDKAIDTIILNALNEDIPDEDISSVHLFTDQQSEAIFIAKESGIVSGLSVAGRVFELVDETIEYKMIHHEGAEVETGDVLAIIRGNTASLLKAERTALNLLQRMSGISTLTKKYVDAIAHTQAKILDTRKTMPNLRILDKIAVTYGQGFNHRMHLSDQVLLKDNHIHAAGSISQAVNTVYQKVKNTKIIEVEVETIAQFEEALQTPCDIIMLDNMSLDVMHHCVTLNQSQKKLEASGNVTLQTVKAIAETGVDFISVGAITHSVKAFDISMKFQTEIRGSNED